MIRISTFPARADRAPNAVPHVRPMKSVGIRIRRSLPRELSSRPCVSPPRNSPRVFHGPPRGTQQIMIRRLPPFPATFPTSSSPRNKLMFRRRKTAPSPATFHTSPFPRDKLRFRRRATVLFAFSLKTESCVRPSSARPRNTVTTNDA